MENQIIIALGREFGSGGHEAGQKLADRFGIKFLDHYLLQTIADEKCIDIDLLKKYDEKPKNRILSRTVSGYSNALEEHVANFQFDYIRRMADEGESFVVIGRCAEHILRGNPALISAFVLGNMDEKCKRIMDYYCSGKWGDSRNYDLCINTTGIQIKEIVSVMEKMF